MGLAVARYQVRLEPITSASQETLVAWLGPVLQRCLTGRLRPELAFWTTTSLMRALVADAGQGSGTVARARPTCEVRTTLDGHYQVLER